MPSCANNTSLCTLLSLQRQIKASPPAQKPELESFFVGFFCRFVHRDPTGLSCSLVPSPLLSHPVSFPAARTCPWPLPPGENSGWRLLHPTPSFSALLEVRCKPGFAFPSGLDVTRRRCQGDRQWSGEEPVCTSRLEQPQRSIYANVALTSLYFWLIFNAKHSEELGLSPLYNSLHRVCCAYHHSNRVHVHNKCGLKDSATTFDIKKRVEPNLKMKACVRGGGCAFPGLRNHDDGADISCFHRLFQELGVKTKAARRDQTFVLPARALHVKHRKNENRGETSAAERQRELKPSIPPATADLRALTLHLKWR